MAGDACAYGPNYLVSTPVDRRLITAVPPAVAQAAIGSGVARKPIVDWERYCDALRARLDPPARRSARAWAHSGSPRQ
jgi:malate dehydrogenase (oxaloacetate-decarboxylating)(NADP+)